MLVTRKQKLSFTNRVYLYGKQRPHLQFFGRKVNVPSINHDNVVQENYLRGIPLPGTRLEFEDLQVEFLVDEDLQNYMEIHKWLYGIGYPDSLDQIYDWQQDRDASIEQAERSQLNLYSDGTMNINNSSNIPSFKVKFQNLFPVSLTTLEFDASLTDLDYLKAVAHSNIPIILLKRLLPVVDD